MSLDTLKKFSASLRELPRVVAQEVALAAAPVLTDAARTTFAAAENAYGTAWAPGAEGQRIKLLQSGALARGVRYVAIGTRIRVTLGVDYAKYQIGRRPIFPPAGAPLPTSYVRALEAATARVLREHLKVAA